MTTLSVAMTALLVAAPAPAERRPAPKHDVFVKTAVLEGLTEDGVTPTVAAQLAEHPDFVPKCILCDQTRAALLEYAKMPQAPAAKPGRGLPAGLAARLASTEVPVRRDALRDLVDRYMERGFTRYELTADEKASLQQAVKAMVYKPKNGVLPNGLKFCPSCEGACRLRPAITP